MFFEWDPDKALTNELTHGVSFREASTIFDDSFAETYFDLGHSDDEDRFITIGFTHERRLIFVAHTERGDNLRLISARLVTRRERKQYEKNRGEDEYR